MGQSTYMRPPRVAWTSSQHGGWILRARVPHNRADAPGTFLTQLWKPQSVALAVTSTHQVSHKVPPRFKAGA